MHGLRGLAVDVRGEKATTQDVTEEYSDVQTQLASLEATHAQLLELLKRATTVEETLKIQQEANKVKLQIDRLKGRSTALERLTEFATVTAKAQAADVVIQRDYVAVRAALRRAETNRANLEAQLKRARTPEEEAAIRDKLSEVLLEIERHKTRIAELESKAAAAKITLPTADGVTTTARPDESLPQEYIETRVALRRAEYRQAEVTRALRAGRPGADPEELTRLILEVQQLSARLKGIEERARVLGITLPALTPEQEAALAGIPTGSGSDLLSTIRSAWEASLDFLSVAGGRFIGALVFLWWTVPLVGVAGYLLRRRVLAR
jgi:chromosome segregation ATPase